MRRVFVLVVVAGLLTVSTVAVADQERGRGRGGPFTSLGVFDVEPSGRNATGEHVSFSFSEAGIADFRAANRTLFDLTVFGVAAADDDDDDGDDARQRYGARTEGSQLRVRMPNFTFTAHDGPTAASKLATDGRAEIRFEEGVVLSSENGERVRFSFGDLTGALRGDDVAVSGRTVTAGEEIVIVLDAPRGPFNASHRDLGRAIARGHIGAEATLNLGDDDRLAEDVVSYGNVTVTTLKAERGNITVAIDGHGFEGRVVVLNVDGRVLGAESADKLDVVIDNETVAEASNLTDILDPDDDGFHPEYYIVFDPGTQAFQLIVTLPHYSVHILSVTTLAELVKPSIVIGAIAGVALLVPTAMLLFRRK